MGIPSRNRPGPALMEGLASRLRGATESLAGPSAGVEERVGAAQVPEDPIAALPSLEMVPKRQSPSLASPAQRLPRNQSWRRTSSIHVPRYASAADSSDSSRPSSASPREKSPVRAHRSRVSTTDIA